MNLCVKTLLVIVLLVVRASGPLAAEGPEYKLAIREKGKVAYQKPKMDEWTSVIASVLLRDGDVLQTYEGAQASLRLHDGSTVKVGEKTLVEVSQYSGEKQGWLQVFLGKALIHVKKALGARRDFKISTPTTTLAARGTVFTVDVVNAQGATIVQAIHGAVEVYAHGVRTVLGAGRTAVVRPGAPPAIVPPGFHVILVAVPAPSGSKEPTHTTPLISSGSAAPSHSQTVYEAPWKPADYAAMVAQDAPAATAAPPVSSTTGAYSQGGAVLAPAGSTSSDTSASSSTSGGASSATATTTTTTATATTPPATTTTLPPPVTPPLVPTGGIQVIVK